MSDVPYSTFDVSVPGGTLHVGQWGASGPVVLALHGITANHRSFQAVADQLGPDVRLVAPDLRGRGRSRDITGPFSMAAHADDATAVLDHLGVDRALVAGHSMGGFVTVVFGDRHADRASRLVLLDGGLPLDLPEAVLSMPTEQLIAAVIGPAMDRLDMTFPSVEAYVEFWKPHPAVGGDHWSPYIEQYVAYDLCGDAPELRPTARKEAILGDTESQLVSDDIPAALDRLRHETLLVRAERGILDGDPLYAEDYAERWVAEKAPLLRLTTVPDVNHYTIVINEPGAKAVADLLRRELAAETT